jgi:excisionase family DNA binding protein
MELATIADIPVYNGKKVKNIPQSVQDGGILYFHKGFSLERPKRMKRIEIPIWEKSNLTLEEAAAYSGIGREKLRHMSDKEDCPFVLWNGTKRLFKRRKLDEYMDGAYSI